MKILAMDTSSSVLSLGISDSDRILGELMQNKALAHSESLMPHIRYLFSMTGEKIQDIDYFAVTVGPGSFTGIRIAVATANAFAMAHNKKVIGISTLEALAYHFKAEDLYVVSTMYAQREDYYRAIYHFDSAQDMKTYKEAEVLCVDRISEEVEKLSSAGKSVMIAGEIVSNLHQDAELLNKVVNPITKKSIIEVARHADNYVRGAVLCELAKKHYDKGSASASPIYIRKPQAEEQYEERQKNMRKTDER